MFFDLNLFLGLRTRDISDGVNEWRSLLREEDQFAKETFCSINNEELAEEFAHITTLGAKKRRERFVNVALSRKNTVLH